MSALFGHKDYGAIYSDDGEHLKSIRIKNKENSFIFDDKTFVLDRKKFKPLERNGVFYNKRYYHYNINNSFPFLLDKKGEPFINAEQLNILMETKVLKDLNALGNNWLKNIKIQHVLIGLGILAAIYYFANGGSLT